MNYKKCLYFVEGPCEKQLIDVLNKHHPYIALTAFSFFHHSFLSAELTARTTETSSQNRTDYIDENGLITFAEDKGYASVVKTLDSDGHVMQS